MAGDSADGRHHDVIAIDGMFCAACAASVEAVLRRFPGVSSAAVNFAADAAVLTWGSESADRRGVIEAVRRLGYRARIIGDNETAESSSNPSSHSRFGLRLIIAAFFGMWAMLPSIALYIDSTSNPAQAFALACASGVLSLPVVLYSGLPFYRMGFATLRNGVAGIDALITIGVAGSLVLSAIALVGGSAEVYFEVAIALITLQLVARLLDLRMRGRARDAVLAMLDLAPARVTLVADDGSTRSGFAAAVKVGERARLNAGDSVGIDGRVVAGEAHINRSLLTGESTPARVTAGDSLHAGEQIINGSVDVEVTAAAGKRRIDGIARQVRQMLAMRPAWQRIADLIARYFLWFSAVAAGVGAAVVVVGGGSASEAAVRALAVFVIACPCALSLAAPIVGLTATATASRLGIILRDLNAISGSAVPTRIFLDKTGTLTNGTPHVSAVHTDNGHDETYVLEVAAAAEGFVEHPFARAVLAAAEKPGINVLSLPEDTKRSVSVTPGAGVLLEDSRQTIRVGRIDWLRGNGVVVPELPEQSTTRAGVAVNNVFIGAIDVEDTLRPGACDLIRALKDMGLEPILLSGDGKAPVARAAARLDIAAHWDLSPEDKAAVIKTCRAQGFTTAFAGDGLNDGPALAAADLGIAVGGATDAARYASAITLVDADVTKLPSVFRLTRQARNVLRQGLALAIIYNLVAIPAAVIGLVHPAIAAVAMALSSVTIVLNSMRAGRLAGDIEPVEMSDLRGQAATHHAEA